MCGSLNKLAKSQMKRHDNGISLVDVLNKIDNRDKSDKMVYISKIGKKPERLYEIETKIKLSERSEKMKNVILLSLIMLVMGGADSASAIDLLASFEPNEAGCLVVQTRSSKDPTLSVEWPVPGGANDVPEATEGNHVLKMQWTNEVDRKVEIGLYWFCRTFDYEGYDWLAVDIYVDTSSALHVIGGIWDDPPPNPPFPDYPSYWLGFERVPLCYDDWYTVFMYVGNHDYRNLNQMFALVFDNLAGDAGTIYIDNLRLQRAPRESTTRKISFAGLQWTVKDSGWGRLDPGNNYWSDSEKNVWVDPNGYLHIKIAERCGKWFCSEVICDSHLGPGKTIFTIKGRPDLLDPYIVLGLFLFDIPDAKLHEIDIEFAKWWNPNNPYNASYCVQPWEDPCNIVRFKVDCNAIDITTHEIIWTPERVDFRSYFGDYPLSDPCDRIFTWSYTGPDIPQAKDERARMNFWLLPPEGSQPGTPGAPPMDGQEAEIVIRDKNSFLAYSGKGIRFDIPQSVYPPDYFKK